MDAPGHSGNHPSSRYPPTMKTSPTADRGGKCATMFGAACAELCGKVQWAIMLLVLEGPAQDTNTALVPEVVWLGNVPHDPYLAVIWMRNCGVVE